MADDGGHAWAVNGDDVHGGADAGVPLDHAAGSPRRQTTVQPRPPTGNAATTGGQTFADLRTGLTNEFATRAGYADRGVATEYRDAPVLNLTGTDKVFNVFDVTADQWDGADEPRLTDVPDGSIVPADVSGGSVTSTDGSTRLNGADTGRVLLNFYQATAVSYVPSDITGSACPYRPAPRSPAAC